MHSFKITRKPAKSSTPVFDDYRGCVEVFNKKLQHELIRFTNTDTDYAVLKNISLTADMAEFEISIEPMDISEHAAIQYEQLVDILNDDTTRIGVAYTQSDDLLAITGVILYKDDGTLNTYDKNENVLACAYSTDIPENATVSGTETNAAVREHLETLKRTSTNKLSRFTFKRCNIVTNVEEHIEWFICMLNNAIANTHCFIKMGSNDAVCRIGSVELTHDKRHIQLNIDDPHRCFEHIASVVHFKVGIFVDPYDKTIQLQLYGSLDKYNVPFQLLATSGTFEIPDMPSLSDNKSRIFYMRRADTKSELFRTDKFIDSVKKFNNECKEHLTSFVIFDHNENAGYIVGCELMENGSLYRLSVELPDIDLINVLDNEQTHIGAMTYFTGSESDPEVVIMSGIHLYKVITIPYELKQIVIGEAICQKISEDVKNNGIV